MWLYSVEVVTICLCNDCLFTVTTSGKLSHYCTVRLVFKHHQQIEAAPAAAAAATDNDCAHTHSIRQLSINVLFVRAAVKLFSQLWIISPTPASDRRQNVAMAEGRVSILGSATRRGEARAPVGKGQGHLPPGFEKDDVIRCQGCRKKKFQGGPEEGSPPFFKFQVEGLTLNFCLRLALAINTLRFGIKRRKNAKNCLCLGCTDKGQGFCQFF